MRANFATEQDVPGRLAQFKGNASRNPEGEDRKDRGWWQPNPPLWNSDLRFQISQISDLGCDNRFTFEASENLLSMLIGLHFSNTFLIRPFHNQKVIRFTPMLSATHEFLFAINLISVSD